MPTLSDEYRTVRIYNQTNCAAPAYPENALLTEKELQAFISGTEESEDEGEYQGFGGMNM